MLKFWQSKADKAQELIAQGHALEEAGDLQAALQSYEAAIALVPTLARAHLNRGNVALAQGDTRTALQDYRSALALQPDYPEAHCNCGNALAAGGQLEQAVAAYREALRIKPEFIQAEIALGAVLDDMRRYAEAAACYQRALAIQPAFAQVHSNLGNALRALGEFEAAIASYRHALELQPDYAVGHNNLGNALKDIGALAEAQACYRRAVELDPDFSDAHSNLLFLLNYGDNADLALHEARAYGQRVTARAQAFQHGPREAARRLRIGFISGDFREHPVSYFFESVLAALAKRCGLEVFCYSNHVHSDATTARLRALCHWRQVVGLSDSALAQGIRQDGIDILIDLAGHTAHNRLPLFAWKPAPLQIAWLGYFGTTGVAAIDYLLADPWSLPPDGQARFTEKICELPHTRLCFTPPSMAPEVAALPDGMSFGCFNNLSKMGDEVVALWSRVLQAVPDSRLLLKSPQLKEASVQQRVRERFAGCGISAERLQFDGLSSRADYLAAYGRIAIALDPFPYTGGTTTMEALWMGVPVLTLQGDSLVSRQGVGLLMNAGLAQCIAKNPDDYVARAAALAGDRKALASLRSTLRGQLQRSPLCDAEAFAQDFEDALRSLWAA